MKAYTTYHIVKSLDTITTQWFTVKETVDRIYAIVFTRDEDLTIWGKVAYLPKNSAMAEYDIDWIMPYNEATGEVDDTETAIDSDRDVQWLIDEAERITKEV